MLSRFLAEADQAESFLARVYFPVECFGGLELLKAFRSLRHRHPCQSPVAAASRSTLGLEH